MKNKFKIIFLVVICLVSSMILTSCDIFDLLYLTEDEESETSSMKGSDTVISGDNITNNIVIQGGDTSTLTYAINSGLRSAVSVYCNFERSGTFSGSATSAGSGVIFELDEQTGSAFIITNYHVVHDSESSTKSGISDEIYLFLYGMEYNDYAIPATYVGGSMNYDIAVLRVDNSVVLKNAIKRGSVCEATIANSDDLVVGEATIAIGNPEMYGISATTGVVSVDSEYIDMTASDGKSKVRFRVIRTDTAVNSGNSGGGLFNAKGELIGIVNAKISSTDVENIGYAIPSNVAKAIANNIIDYCYQKDCKTVMRGLLGISIVPSEVYTVYDEETGILKKYEEIAVAEVTDGGLGENIIKKDDIIKTLKIGERQIEITRQYHLIDAMLDVRVGDKITLVIERNGETKEVETVITEDCLTAY